MKYAANIITTIRLLVACLLLFTRALSPLFFLLYIICGISDMLDGFVARKTNTATSTGAVLDSLGDLVFLAVAAIKLLPVLHLPSWVLWWALLVALIRLLSYLIGYIKYRKFASLHTYLNKLTGLLLFLSPLLYLVLGAVSLALIVIAAAIISACEELFITLQSKELDRDRKGLFLH
ncbi:CDP-alcohol phosphatidyltransferase family protein [Enterococcus larvae]|uniref:CDP-alcohol phosphatidyltransferase family protein n=1 Tax=Enterococcus larvae TaxID=2794352 RepID=UPI003F375085